MSSFVYQYDRHREAVVYAIKQIQASPLAPYVEDIILFGSVARQTARFNSDVDLLLLLSAQAFRRPEFAKESRLLRVDVQTDDYRDAEVDLRIEQNTFFQTSTQTIDVFIKEEGISVWKTKKKHDGKDISSKHPDKDMQQCTAFHQTEKLSGTENSWYHSMTNEEEEEK